MDYCFAPQLLLRMPVRDPAAYAANRQTFLDDLIFRSALYLASPVFYASLERQNFQFSVLSEKEAVTLQKYINRYCFRPTPFGLFASVSLVEWGKQVVHQPGTEKFHAYIRASMPYQLLLNSHFFKSKPKEDLSLEANPSIYRILNEYRFFRTGVNESGKQRDYQLQSIAFSKILKDLINNSSKSILRAEVVSQIVSSAGCTAAEAEDYTDFLIDSQLLLSTSRLSISGSDQLEQLASSINDSKTSDSGLPDLIKQGYELSLINPVFIKHLENQLNTLLPEPEDSGKLSVILKRSFPAYRLSPVQKDKLREGISALELLSTHGRPDSISKFIRGFQQHFEGQTLPLMQALDPEAGIGYQQPETEKHNPLLETLHIPYRDQPQPGGTWSAVHSVLLESWLRARSGGPVISILESDLDKLKSDDTSPPMLGMSVLFRTVDDKLFIENAGGINAPALMGRFTVADEAIAKAAQSMALQIEEQNPQLIFAELLHLADPHIDNVNRRAHIYQYELPITAASTLPAEKQIQLSDLYLKVVNNTIILFSEKHQKVVIPRLTSAYNHTANKLPLFRFLADLSYQYGRSGLGLDLRQLFPNLKFYPRVEFKNTILSLATWIISSEQINSLIHNQTNLPEAFSKFSMSIQLTPYFSFAERDQELVFNSHNPGDIDFFVNCIRQKKEVTLKEFIYQDKIQQYNAYLLPTEPLQLPNLISLPKTKKTKIQRKYVPGSTWLYLKVYAPKIGVNRLLLRLRPLLSRRYGANKIEKWFFIRYDDHAPHIRLRLQVVPDSISDILLAFKVKLEDRIQQHVIREFQIDVYTRELERYAAGGINNTEHFFWASSELVLSFLKHRKYGLGWDTHTFALYSTQLIISIMIHDPAEQITFAMESFQQFLPEFAERSFKVDLDKKYRELTPDIIKAFQSTDPAILSGSTKAGNRYRQSLLYIQENTGKVPDPDYLRSIIHMHLNRIFTDESRKQEMICYYLLHKYLLSQKGRNKRNRL